MKTTLSIVALLAFTLIAVASTNAQQTRIIQTPNGPRIVQSFVQPQGYPQQPVPQQPVPQPQVFPQRPHAQPLPHTTYPPQTGMVYDRIHGGWVTPNQATGINSQTLGIDTSSAQVMDSAFHPDREQSKYNGTRRYVNNPVYGPNGNITGYEQGYVWQNSTTGQWHRDTKVVTPNSSNGINTQTYTVNGQGNPNIDYSKGP